MKRSRVSGTEEHHRRADEYQRVNKVRKELAAERFIKLCKETLSLDPVAQAVCLEIYGRMDSFIYSSSNLSLYCASWAEIGNHKPSTNPILVDEAVRLWFAFALYCATRLEKSVGVLSKMHSSASKEGLTLTHILRSCDLKLEVFLKELPIMVLKAGPTMTDLYHAGWERKLKAKELYTNFVHLNILSRHYKEAYWELFSSIDPASNNLPATSSGSQCASDYLRLGWLLFVALRSHAFGCSMDLVTCINDLISVLAILIMHVPAHFRIFSFKDDTWFVVKDTKRVDLIASLSKNYDTSEDDVLNSMEKTVTLIREVLQKKPRTASECDGETLADLNIDGLSYFEDLMEESSLRNSLIMLEMDYDLAMSKWSQLDERVFLDEAANCSFAEIHMMPAKCVKAVMKAANWLRNVVCRLSREPSAKLMQSSVGFPIVKNALVMLEALFPSNAMGEEGVCGSLQSTSTVDNIWIEQRRQEVLKIYYKVLDAMCTAYGTNLTSLLTKERFHRCMLVCSAELVLAARKPATMLLFPTILEQSDITAFELVEVLQCFLRHEESMPCELRMHLESLKERLLESTVWEAGSLMYDSLEVAEPMYVSEVARLRAIGRLPYINFSLDAIVARIHLSSVLKHEMTHGPCTDLRSGVVEQGSRASRVTDHVPSVIPTSLHCAFARPRDPCPGREFAMCADMAIDAFLKEIKKLASVRICGMAEELEKEHRNFNVEVCRKLFNEILYRRTALFFNLHIDAILICCFFLTSKITRLGLTMMDLLLRYMKQPHSKPQVFRCVFIDSSVTKEHRLMFPYLVLGSSYRVPQPNPEHVGIFSYYPQFFDYYTKRVVSGAKAVYWRTRGDEELRQIPPHKWLEIEVKEEHSRLEFIFEQMQEEKLAESYIGDVRDQMERAGMDWEELDYLRTGTPMYEQLVKGC
ncbi:unnamed protein product [Linum trigynum]|uniref:Uncharacterized protein n=1 Tax=Linum trigynum TaxID=586398 RepID=A0AAV2ENU7_9ROSI